MLLIASITAKMKEFFINTNEIAQIYFRNRMPLLCVFLAKVSRERLKIKQQSPR